MPCMRCVVQRVRRGAVTINGGERREIGRGLVVLIGVHHDDTEQDAAYLADKIAGLRIFPDTEGKMNLSVLDLARAQEGLEHQDQPPIGCLIVSQFTLYGDARKGKRPSFTDAAPPAVAIPLYERFVRLIANAGLHVETGEFGADMLVEIENNGPVTILLDAGKQF
jgi:D-tyrosyl-tRNA(Tyr) deacylase